MAKPIDPEVRATALSRVAAGESAARVAADLGLNRKSLYHWVAKQKSDKADEQHVAAPEEGRVTAKINGALTIEGPGSEVGMCLALLGYDHSEG